MKKKMKKITNWLFVTTQISALLWVTMSYAIAMYATLALKQPFPIYELSQTAVEVILGSLTLKVIGNIFEHNNGKLFGVSDNSEENQNGDQLG